MRLTLTATTLLVATLVAITGPTSLFGQTVMSDKLDMTASFSDVYNKPQRLSVKHFGFGAMDEKKQEQLDEDCSVMNHLIKRTLPTASTKNTMGVTVTHSYGRNEALYVDGRGLILNYHVGFPVAPNKDDDQKTAKDLTADKVDEWEKARTEMKSGNVVVDSNVKVKYIGFNANYVYDKKRIAKLDGVIKKALSHVGKIRNLKSSDSVTVYVRGLGGSVMAWKVNMADVRSDRPVSADRIKSVQYRERIANRGTTSGYFYEVGPRPNSKK